MTMYRLLRYVALSAIVIGLFACAQKSKTPRQSGAGLAMEQWALTRSWPDGRIYAGHISAALAQRNLELDFRTNTPQWEALGPKNIGGRTISLAFHPTDSNIIYVGTCGGGLWRTTSAGVGVDAWERIPTGFPVLAVGAIAINPDNPDEMYIGTGEVYNYTAAAPNVYNRLTRGSYGIGILKTVDGGATWTKSLDWSLDELTGVWDLVINQQNPSTVWAATTRGLYRSNDAGQSWTLAHDLEMAVDLEIHPADTSKMWVSHGAYLSPDAGVYRSTDGGATWNLSPGLPSDYTGKTKLAISPYQPDVMYASVADAFVSRGLYRSTDGGNNWQLMSNKDVAAYQGWYSHDVAIVPNNPNTVLYCGVDMHKSTTAGTNPIQKTYWYNWDFGVTPVGGPEGPPNYVHADIHGIYFSPYDTHYVFAVTDGGIFFSSDAGESWEGRNGGFQTQQFYANFSNSATDANFAIGGMQDNATAIYLGGDAWRRVIGGDGMSTAINPNNDMVVYGTSQNLNLQRSLNRGQTFSSAAVTSANGEAKNFNAPYELSPHDPNVIYAGAQRLHRTTNGGTTWTATSTALVDGGNSILTIAISPFDEDVIYIGTSPNFNDPRILKSTNGGSTWTYLSGLPNRTAMDIVFHPEEPETVFAVFSGFNTQHVYRSTDGGATWTAIDNGLPDVPTNTLFIDPDYPDHLYVGNDIGLYISYDNGDNWEPYGEGPEDAVLVMHLSRSPANNKLRIATHGLGVYQVDLAEPPVTSGNEPAKERLLLKAPYPNPASDVVTIEWQLPTPSRARLSLYNAQGRLIRVLENRVMPAGEHQYQLSVKDLASGVYAFVLEGNEAGKTGFRMAKAFIVSP